MTRQERARRLGEPSSSPEPVVGLMIRREWTGALIEEQAELGLTWLEIFPENYMRRGVSIRSGLRRLAELYPISSHACTSRWVTPSR